MAEWIIITATIGTLSCNCSMHIITDRSANKRIGAYQEWLKAPDYVGKSEADIAAHTITSLKEVKQRLIEANM